ncbi:hypothetical protein QJS66_21465 [Kocuria rhizophila]|nr:hypothetical protein QJS66_21465 [Kocuria rhizophila]
MFDSHLHIIDPAHPLAWSRGYLPGRFTVADYRRRVSGLGIAGGAVVSGAFQGFDQGYLIEALRQLGPGFARHPQLPADADDGPRTSTPTAECGRRFNVARGGLRPGRPRTAGPARSRAGRLARGVLHRRARSIDETLSRRIAAPPAASIHHLGMHEDGPPALLRLERA